MDKITRVSFQVARVAAIGVFIASLSACAVSRTQAHAGIGAVAGGALGYVLTGGPIGTVAGAAAGGLIGAGVR
ncbi:ornithine acetyltransferase [Caballeronia sp. LjRoot31]|uniref:ornithine acetyltransferase n=1 Tax=Caballeronia sp. LjRoot31 TaxID=3342324 RepID=UPI003ECC389D